MYKRHVYFVAAFLCAATPASAQEPAQDLWAAGPYGAGYTLQNEAASEFKLNIGGHIKLDMIVDSQQIDSDLPFFALPERVITTDGAGAKTRADNPKANTLATNLAARELVLHFGTSTPRYDAWQASAYIEFNFLGFLPGYNAGSPSPILRHGYAKLTNEDSGTTLLFGQAQGPFAPIDPQTLNWETLVLMGDIFTRLPQVRLTQTMGDFSAAVALVRPADYLNDTKRGYDVQGRGQDSGLPEVQARVQYSLPLKGGHYWFYETGGAIGLSGRAARERFDAGTDAQQDITSWTAALDWIIPAGPVTIAGELYYGQDTDNVYGLSGVARAADGALEPISELGGWASIGYRPTPRVYTSLIYGRIQPDKARFARAGVTQDNGLDIEHNQTVTTNLYYRILPTLFVAGEYAWLNTSYYQRTEPDGSGSSQAGSLHRAQASLLFSF
jgi:hypothetical protein